MKEIIKQYGAVMITGLLLISLVGIIAGMKLKGKTGIAELSGDFLDRRISGENFEVSTINHGYDSYRHMGFPEVTVSGGMMICENDRIKVSDYFGTEISIDQVKNAYGEVVNDVVVVGDELTFPKAGVYSIRFKVGYENGPKKSMEVSVPVNPAYLGKSI